MACWWVFQNKSYEQESTGSYLWAPLVNSQGHHRHYWDSMKDLQEGDIVFSSVKRKIVAISTVISSSYSSPKPVIEHPWHNDGLRADLLFTELKVPIDVGEISNTLLNMMKTLEHAPLNVNGGGNQGYLFNISDAIGNYLISLSEENNDFLIEEKEVSDIQKISNINETEKQALIKSRVGQGRFREDLLHYWDNRCAVTELHLPKLLKASHIKPWKLSNNSERLDPNNGLLLSPNYDEAFDKGFISFEDDGSIIFSHHLKSECINALGFSDTNRIRKDLTAAQKMFLEYHRSERLI